MSLSLDLLLTIRETQLQHGLRAEDYGRYHRYLTNRLATLRKQLGLSNDKKRFANKPIPTTGVKDSRYVVLLALYAERCWAECEQQLAARANAGGDAAGLPPATQARKRLNKAVRWAEQLVRLVEGNADARLLAEARGFLLDMRGRCAASHGAHADAKAHFIDARTAYFSLKAQSSEAQWTLLLDKIRELDDRVVFSMQCIGEDITTYHPPADATGPGVAADVNASVSWLGRAVPVGSVKVKDALRDISKLDALALRDAALHAAAAAAQPAASASAGAALPALIPLGTQARVLDAFDRVIGRYNDALIATRQELRDAPEKHKRDLQLLTHYLQFQISLHTLHRTRWMVIVFHRRFALTREALRRAADARAGHPVLATKRLRAKVERELLPPEQYASPAELVRLFDLALQSLSEMELLPGVEDDVALGPQLEQWNAECRAGRLYFAGEGWRAVGERGMAVAALEAARAVAAEPFSAAAARALLCMTADAATPDSGSGSGGGGGDGQAAAAAAAVRGRYVADRPDEFVACTGVVKFPPDYQAVPCKPVFVDIASTHIGFPQLPGASRTAEKSSATGTQQYHHDHQQQQQQQEGKKGSGWFSGWGWGAKK